MKNEETWTTLGHEKQKQLFRKIIKAGELGHAYALVGPEHLGKTTFAWDLAKLLGADPILDVMLYDSSQGLSIEEARSLQGRLSLTAVSKTKIAIIAEAEKMTLAAANSLLKILEEPPAHSLIILTTSNFYELLPTVASRVQKIFFSPLADDKIKEILRKFDLDKAKKAEIVKFAKGRVGLAIRLAENPELYNFWRSLESYYLILEEGSLVGRLQAAAKLVQMEDLKYGIFLKFAMQRWVSHPTSNPSLGQKLRLAWDDLKFNLNPKLVFDNLFASVASEVETEGLHFRASDANTRFNPDGVRRG